MKRHLIIVSLVLWPSLAVWATSGPEPKSTPTISGPWQLLFQPQKAGSYINDHCLFQDREGNWHLIGISSHLMILYFSDRWFAHGMAPFLGEPMRELGPLFQGWPDQGLKWAPHAVWDGDTLHLFAGPGKVRHFVSRDGYQFEFAGIAVEGWRWLRDTMIIRGEDRSWIMYATDQDDTISAFRSPDLNRWERVGTVFKAKKPAPVWSPYSISSTESPFVIKRDDGYYLSVCLTNYPRQLNTYLNTLIFFSANPLDFGVYAAGGEGETARLVTRLTTHAAEYIQDQDGSWWITCSGWKGYPRPAGCPGGQACLAPLTWVPRP